MTELKLRGDLLMSAPGVGLTNRSFSLAIDVGMYLARTFEHAYPQLAWKQFLVRMDRPGMKVLLLGGDQREGSRGGESGCAAEWPAG